MVTMIVLKITIAPLPDFCVPQENILLKCIFFSFSLSCPGQVTRIALLWTLASWVIQQPWLTTLIFCSHQIEAPPFLIVG